MGVLLSTLPLLWYTFAMMKRLKKITIRGLSALSSLLLTALIIIGVVYTYFYLSLPNVETLKNVQMQVPLRIYTSDRKLIGIYGEKRRIPITLEQVPKALILAVLATEDKRYFEHSGVDIIGLARATKALLLTGRKSQGASTITMQVARNFFLTRKKTFKRKIKEILLALKINREFSKRKILELYLNKIYLGHRAYGVAAAAQIYYGKSLNELTLAQVAMIAGLPQAPSRSNPISNPDAAIKRRNHVLERMLEAGYINNATYQKTIKAPHTAFYHDLQIDVDAPYVAEMVRQVMVEQFGKEAYTRGFDVITTLNSRLQRAANTSVKKGIMQYEKRHGRGYEIPKIQGALVALKPKNGAIVALVGGYDFRYSHYNRITQSKRQPGSSFKPFIYSAALEKGYTLASTINDEPIVMNSYGEDDLWRPHNVNQKFHGPTRLRIGLIKSRNLVSIRLLRATGISYTLNYIKRFGFKPSQLPNSLSLALGSGAITPMQLSTGYAVFANGGFSVEPFFIDTILEDNALFYQAKPREVCDTCENKAPRVLSQDNVFLMTNVLQDVIKNGTGRAARILNRSDIAGKTGTTNKRNDAWFVGFTPNIVTTVWVGYDEFKSIHEYGAQAALPIWVDFMRTALEGTSITTQNPPENIITARIDPKTGMLAYPGQPNAIFEMFRQKFIPQKTAALESERKNSELKNQSRNTSEELF